MPVGVFELGFELDGPGVEAPLDDVEPAVPVHKAVEVIAAGVAAERSGAALSACICACTLALAASSCA
jgi:hypothetical protein